jgi:uncharacterized protein
MKLTVKGLDEALKKNYARFHFLLKRENVQKYLEHSMQKNIMSPEIVNRIATSLSIKITQVEKTLSLSWEGCTVPFIARYRKEATEFLDEVQIREVMDHYDYLKSLAERKETILKSIEEQNKLTPLLAKKIQDCFVKSELEDLYLPYKPKRKTKGQAAKEKGLDTLAQDILSHQSDEAILEKAQAFVGTHETLKTKEDVLNGVKDFICEEVSENADLRKELRAFVFEQGILKSSFVGENPEQKTKFTDYYAYEERIKSIPPHRFMALKRGEKENLLRLDLNYDEDEALSFVKSVLLKPAASEDVVTFLSQCAKDALHKNLSPSLETEIRLEKKNLAEDEAIKIFEKNLKHLLLLPPIPKTKLMGIDPGLRTGSKVVVLDETGKLLSYLTIFPNFHDSFESSSNQDAFQKLFGLIEKFNIKLLSIGNGTGSRELEEFIEKNLKKVKREDISVCLVNEAGASVYSASDLAREEFPDLDISYRGAVSIGRRFQDPLAELVKIDPKSIGVGQYQHDVNQTKLKKQLGEVVESCVNFVGVDLNTASQSLLSYVAGISSNVAKNIILYREAQGLIKNREELKNIDGFGPKTFEQSVGFIRVKESTNPLDRTGVHPESYYIVEHILQKTQISLDKLLGNKELLTTLSPKDYVDQAVGEATFKDIVQELLKPGRDPREGGSKRHYRKDIRSFESLVLNEVMDGTVSNVTNFGAFVDIGVHQDGLVHISEVSHEFITDITKALQVGQKVKVKVIEVDKERKRISLSMKALEPAPSHQAKTQDSPSSHKPFQAVTQRNDKRPSFEKPHFKNKEERPSYRPQEKKAPEKPASMEDLLSKFNSHNA